MRQDMRHASGERARAQSLPCSPVADVGRVASRQSQDKTEDTKSESCRATSRALEAYPAKLHLRLSYQEETTTFTLSPSRLPSTPSFFLVCLLAKFVVFIFSYFELSKVKILKLYGDSQFQ